MISSNDQRIEGPNIFCDFIGIGAVTNQIAAANHAVVLSSCLLSHGLEGFQIRVNVAQNQESHVVFQREFELRVRCCKCSRRTWLGGHSSSKDLTGPIPLCYEMIIPNRR